MPQLCWLVKDCSRRRHQDCWGLGALCSFESQLDLVHLDVEAWQPLSYQMMANVETRFKTVPQEGKKKTEDHTRKLCKLYSISRYLLVHSARRSCLETTTIPFHGSTACVFRRDGLDRKMQERDSNWMTHVAFKSPYRGTGSIPSTPRTWLAHRGNQVSKHNWRYSLTREVTYNCESWYE